MTTDAELAQFDKSWWGHEAARAFSIDGALDYGAADEVRRLTGLGMSETIANLRAANDGEYEGSPEGGRAVLDMPGARRRLAERAGIDVGEAAVELAGTSTEAGSARIAALADDLVASEKEAGREMDYLDALVEVQRPSYRISRKGGQSA